MIPQPDPPLRSGDLLLRPWSAADAPSLVEAWADEEIQRWTAVPPNRDLAYAEHWIAGWDARREADLSLDLVVDRAGEVVGEVGLSSLDRVAGTVEIGWWTGAHARRQGIASAAARLLVDWASPTLGVGVVASCNAANPGSLAVAESAGAIVIIDGTGS